MSSFTEMTWITRQITNKFLELTRIIQQSTIRIRIDSTMLQRKTLSATTKVINIIPSIIPQMRLIWIVNDQRVATGNTVNTVVIPRPDNTVNVTVMAGIPHLRIWRIKTAILSITSELLSFFAS